MIVSNIINSRVYNPIQNMHRPIVRLSLFVVILWVWLLVGNFAFAQDPTAVSETYQDIHNILIMLIKTISWIWILVANIAGKLMSNAFVSGGILWLDKYLFQAWNIVRIIANMLLAVMLFKIWYDVLRTGSAKELSNKIIRTIVAGILINLSWFLLGLIVDLSTVMTVSVSSIWNNIINASPSLKWNMERQYICIPKTYTVNYKQNNSSVESIPSCIITGWVLSPEASEYYNIYQGDEIFDKISPKQDDMSGPLFYFGMSIFRFFDYTDVNSTDTSSLQSITIWFVIKFFLMIMFITPLIALMVVNFKRMIMIWIWFALAPFIVIKNVIKDSWFGFIDKISEGVWGISDSSRNFFNIWSIIWAIFTPVTVVASLYITMFIVGAFAGQLMPAQTNQSTLNTELDSKISIDGKMITLWEGGSFSLDADFTNTKDFVWWAIWYIFLTLFVTMLLRAVLKVWLSTSDLVSSTWQNIMKKWKDAFTQSVTVPTNAWPVSIDQLDKHILKTDNISKNIENLTGISANKKKYKEGFDASVKNSWVWKYLWREGKIDPSVKFDPWYNTKFNTDLLDGSEIKKSDQKRKFEEKSFNYFQWLHKAIYDPVKWWVVDLSYSRNFEINMRGWLEKWWYEYLVDKKIIDGKKDSYITVRKNDKDEEVKSINFGAIAKDNNKFGYLVEKLLDKSTKYSNVKDFTDIVDGIVAWSNKSKFSNNTYWVNK